MSKPKRARVSAADVPIVDVVPHTPEELAAATAEVDAALATSPNDVPTESEEPIMTKHEKKIEVGAAANTSVFFPQTGFLDQPMTFTSGIVFVDDGNVSAITNGERGALFTLRISKPNGTVFDHSAPWGGGPDAFTLAE